MLHLHRSERADALVASLGEVLRQPLADPFLAEVVAVPTRGVERWLSQRLAGVLGAGEGDGDGVCANVVFPFPERLLAAALDAAEPPALTPGGSVSGTLRLVPSSDPWAPDRAVWALIEVVERCAREPWCALLRAHLERGGASQRFAALRHLADLFDRYSVHRPAMVRAWAAGADTGSDDRRLDEDLRWQPRLWRELRNRLGVRSPAERLVEACAALAAGEVDVELPERLALFGLTRLPASYLELLAALAVRRDVHLFLLHPSPELWRAVAEGSLTEQAPAERAVSERALSERGPAERSAGAGPGRPGPGGFRLAIRAEDDSTLLAHHPLLASWGRDAREMQLVIGAVTTAGNAAEGATSTDSHHRAPAGDPSTLLGRIQADIVANRPPPGAPLPGRDDERLLLAAGDTSVQVHDCHGRSRQVEVVRDAILHLLADDPTLEPRDVIVMCPDIESWAPLIRAAFEVGTAPPTAEAGPATALEDASGAEVAVPIDLRARLADRSLRQTNPLFAVVSVLLDLAGSRITASQVLDLAAMAPVRRRFAFDDAELSRLRRWVGDSGVRWGLDAGHRAGFGLGGLAANTWRAGLDRLLLGVAVSEDERQLVGGVLALDDLGSAEVELAGRLAELVERLAATLDELSPPASPGRQRPVSAWAEAISAGLDRLALAAEPERWQRLQVDRLLAEVVDESTGAAAHPAISLAELRSLLADRLRGRPSRANFRTGQLTICTLVPMRSVPHRVVCLLGMDDGSFPRTVVDDGDDLVGRQPWVGDRDARGEDRQLLLDALLAAGEHLVVTYRGRDERTNARRPPAVPVGELLDVVDATARLADDASGPASSRVVVQHPLQPFDPRCFEPGRLMGAVSWSFDRLALGGARALSGPRREPRFFPSAPLPSLEEEVIELAELVRFVQRPVGELFRRRLGLRLEQRSDEVDDVLPVELSALSEFAVGDRLLQGRIAGLDALACEAAERARGALPPGLLAGRVLAACSFTVEELLATWQREVGELTARTIDVVVPLSDGSVLAGSVPGVFGERVCAVGYARLAPNKRLLAWVQLLALAAAGSGEVSGALTVGRATDSYRTKTVGVSSLVAPRRQGQAQELLESLVELYRLGMCEPLPIATRTSEAWASARRRDEGVEAFVIAPAPLRSRPATVAEHPGVADSGAPRSARVRVDPEDPAVKSARPRWESSYDVDHEDKDEANLLAFGRISFEELLGEPPRHEEEGARWPGAEATRFGRYARRLWDPLLAHEELTQR